MEKIIGGNMKKVCYGIVIIVFLLLLRGVSVYAINELVISNYKKEVYNENYIQILYALNLKMSYIDFYNHGNLLYQKQEFEQAKNHYEIALTKHPSKERVCDIRVNLSLSMIAMMGDNLTIEGLEESQAVLYQDNCAQSNGTGGKSKEAESLDEEIEQKKQEVGNSGENNDPNNPDNPEDPSEPPNTQEIEEKLKEQNRKNTQDRQQYLDRSKDLDNWKYYSGKNW